jgi:hypothetical protein
VTDITGATSSQSRTNVVTVNPSIRFTPSNDAYVNNTLPDRNYFSFNILKVRYQDLRTVFRSFISFNVSSLPSPATSAKLRLYVNDPSSKGGTVHLITDPWSEQTLTWNNQPPMSAIPVATIGAAPMGYIDVVLPTSLFDSGAGTYSFGFQSTSPDDVWFDSKENLNPPQLVLGQPAP